MSARLTIAVAISTCLLCCEAPPPVTVPLFVRVEDEAARPISLAEVTLDRVSLKPTDEKGMTRAKISHADGETIRLQVQCPADYAQAADPARSVTVRRWFAEEKNRAQLQIAPLFERFVCRPLNHPSVLVVRTHGADKLPIKALGRTVGETTEEGVALLVIDEASGSEMEVMLDTVAQPDLQPKMPTRRFTVPETSQILVFDQTFSRKKKKKARKNRRRPSTAPRRL